MLQLVFPETPTHELALDPEAQKKGLHPKVVTSRVVVGEPAAVTIHESTLGDDLELKRFFAGQKSQWSFHAVRLSCTFATGEGETFERAHVSVQLSAQEVGSGPGPIAWSMSPLKLVQKTEVKQSVSIGANLQFLKSDMDIDTKYTENDLYVVAYNEQCPNPYWRLKALPGVAIEGIQRLSLIVRVPRTAHAVGQLNVTADIRGHSFLIPCKASVPNIPQLSFSL
jgi:hypothetical protein